MKRVWSSGVKLIALGLGLGFLPVLMSPPAAADPAGTNVVISQVYGGGGNSGATYKNDFIELHNPTSAPIDLFGWSVQYAASTGTSWQKTDLSGSIPAHGYYLIREAQGAGGTTELPTPNASGTIPMSATAGKVVLVNTNALVTAGTSCPVVRVDLVGYGSTTNCSETAPTATLSNTTAALRQGAGAVDTDNNAADFTVGAPDPLRIQSQGLSVGDAVAAEGDAGTTTVSFTVSLGAAAGPGGVTFDIATADGTAASPGDYIAKSLTGQTIPAGGTSYTFDVVVNGDETSEPDETFTVDVTNVSGRYVADRQGVGTIQDDDTDACTQSYTPAYAIQGSGASAAITGTVTTQGVVVGDFEGTAAGSGFYLQDQTGDADPATSDGIFVFTGSTDLVSAGQVVRVTGFARERFGQTTINGSNSNTAAVPAGDVVLCASGASVPPTDVSLPFASATFPERYEGMLTRFPQSLVIAEYFNYDRFGEIVLAQPLAGESRPFVGTAIEPPGAAANARNLANSLSRITLDDAQSAQNPSVLRHPNGQPFSLTNLFRGGDQVQNAVGVLGFDFSLYRIFPTAPADHTAVNPRPAEPEDVGGRLRVAAMNTLNYFVTLDYPSDDPLDNKCGPSQNLECRGADADQPDEFGRQRDKLLQALAGLDADVIGLNELENTTGVEPLASIVSGLPGYAYVDTGTIGTDAIKVGLIYRPDVVTPVGPYKLLTSAVDPRFIDTKSRPSLAQTFQDNATGSRFTVVVNHLKSKGSDCNDVGDPDLGDGQGNCSQTRRAAAEALVDWMATDPTGSGDPDFLVVGDLNSYAMEDAITEIKAGSDDVAGTGDDFTNLIAQYQGAFAYSYTFDGAAGYLDHALASSSLAGQVTGATEWHINSDEPDVLDYDTSFKPPAQEALYELNAYRTSDHDPVVIGLDLDGAPTVSAGGPYSVAEGGTVEVSATGDDVNGDALTYAWDLDDNGSFETPGQTATYAAGSADGPGTRTVRVQATDTSGLTAVDAATVTITNAPPTATFGAPASASAGLPFTLSLTSPDDPSAADDAAGFTYAFDCGDGYGAPSAASTASCTVTETGPVSVGGKVFDKDGGFTEYRVTVQVGVTHDSLCELVELVVTDEDVAASLCAQLNAAEAAEARGDVKTEAKLLNSFRKLVTAQTGKTIIASDATLLKNLSREL